MDVFELVIGMLLSIVALHYAAHRLHLPPAAALLTGGCLLAFLPGLPVLALDPELVLVIFLPPLLMDGAWFIALAHFKRHLGGILSLAVGAVLFTTIVIAAVTHWLLPSLPIAACAALGAILSPPDAVSARAVLQRVKLPRRLSILLEGESLLNDATGLVLFRFAVAATVVGSFSAADAIGSFLYLAIGGAAVGAIAGALWVLLVPRLGDEYLMIASSALTGWATYLAGEMIHVSGVIAVVVVGLICGWYQHVVFSASVRMRGTAFWAVMIFLLEASVFILIGSSLRDIIDRAGGFQAVIDGMAKPIALIILTVILSRFVWVFASDAALALLHRLNLTRRGPLGAANATVLSWTGMRGVVTLAVALTLPAAMPGRDFMLVTAFAVILATVLIQGTSLGWLIRRLRVREAAGAEPRLTRSHAEAAMAQVQLTAVEALAYHEDGTLRHPRLLDSYRRRAEISARYPGQEEVYADDLHAHYDVVLAAVVAARAELIRLHRAADIDDDTLHDLERDLDLEELGAIHAKS